MIQKYVIIGITTQQRFLEEIFVAAIYKDGFWFVIKYMPGSAVHHMVTM